jgi:hypothetical protein
MHSPVYTQGSCCCSLALTGALPPSSCLQTRAGKAQLEAAKQELSTATAELRSARVSGSRQAGAVYAGAGSSVGAAAARSEQKRRTVMSGLHILSLLASCNVLLGHLQPTYCLARHHSLSHTTYLRPCSVSW